jgi:hypothetical protein
MEQLLPLVNDAEAMFSSSSLHNRLRETVEDTELRHKRELDNIKEAERLSHCIGVPCLRTSVGLVYPGDYVEYRGLECGEEKLLTASINRIYPDNFAQGHYGAWADACDVPADRVTKILSRNDRPDKYEPNDGA